MDANDIKVGEWLYHVMFGWCRVTGVHVWHQMALVDLEADEIEYYSHVQYVKYTRLEKGARHPLYTSTENLLQDDKEKLSRKLALKKVALNPIITFW